jgi:hypothetical protein
MTVDRRRGSPRDHPRATQFSLDATFSFSISALQHALLVEDALWFASSYQPTTIKGINAIAAHSQF